MIVNKITILEHDDEIIESITQHIIEYLNQHSIGHRVRQVIQAPRHSSQILSPGGEQTLNPPLFIHLSEGGGEK